MSPDFLEQMSGESVGPYFGNLMMIVTMKVTSGCNVQVYQNLLSESLIAKDEDNDAEMVARFHVGKHEDNPNVHTMALFQTDALTNTTNLHFRILYNRTNVWPANGVVLSFLTVEEEAVSESK